MKLISINLMTISTVNSFLQSGDSERYSNRKSYYCKQVSLTKKKDKASKSFYYLRKSNT